MFNADLSQFLEQALSGLYLLTEMVILIICCLNLRLSRWMWLVALGFALSLAAGVWSRVVVLAINLQLVEVRLPGEISRFFAVGQVAGITAMLLLACGLALVFGDIRGQFENYRIQIIRLSGDRDHGPHNEPATWQKGPR